jgi:phosphate starvation-inducible protein PhoH and related proteins
VHFANLTSSDVVRHRLVGDIVDAYERWDAANDQRQAPSQQQPVRPSRPRRQGS